METLSISSLSSGWFSGRCKLKKGIHTELDGQNLSCLKCFISLKVLSKDDEYIELIEIIPSGLVNTFSLV